MARLCHLIDSCSIGMFDAWDWNQAWSQIRNYETKLVFALDRNSRKVLCISWLFALLFLHSQTGFVAIFVLNIHDLLCKFCILFTVTASKRNQESCVCFNRYYRFDNVSVLFNVQVNNVSELSWKWKIIIKYNWPTLWKG